MGLVFALRLDGGAIERGDGLVMGVGMVLLRLDWCMDESVALRGEISISSCGDSSEDTAIGIGSCFEVAESGEDSVPMSGTVCRRRKELAGGSGGRRAIFCAGSDGLGPQLDIGEKNGEVGLLKSPAKDDRSEKQLPIDVALCECACP